MKICFFNCTTAWGGGEKWHLDHALALQNDGHDVVVVSSKNGEFLSRAIAANIKYKAFTINNLSSINPFKICQLYFFLKAEKFDVLVMNFSKDLKIAAPVAKLVGIPKIIYRRGSAVPIKNTSINRFLYGKCLTHILANSEMTKRTILKNNPDLFPEEKITVIYNGISTENYQYKSYKNEVPVIGNIGRMVYQKRQDILIDVAEILKQRGIPCKFRIGGDGILMNELQKKVLDKNLMDYVEFTGFVKDSNAFLQHIDIFALTSKWEGFGYVLAEAMLAKKPLVAFDISSNPELIKEGINGNLVHWNDKEAFADALQNLILKPQLQKEYGNNGLSIVCEKFDFEKNKLRVMDFLLNS